MNTINAKKATLYYLGASIFNKGVAFFTVPIFTRILSIQDFGIVNTYTAWVSILYLFVSLALYMSVRSAFVDYPNSIDNFCCVVINFTLIWGLLLGGVVSIFSLLFCDKTTFYLTALCSIQSLFDSIFSSLSMLLMMKFKFRLRSFLLVVPQLFSVILSILIIFLLSEQKYFGKIIGSIIGSGILAIFSINYIYQNSVKCFSFEYIKYGLKISIPLVFHGLALTVLSQSDRVMISQIRNTSETAIYSLVYNFGMISFAVTTALEGVYVPFFTKKMKACDFNYINELSSLYAKAICVLLSLIILASPEVIKILAPSEYYEGIKLVPLIVLSNYLIFIYSFYVNVEHYYKNTVSISINTIVAATLNLLLNFYFIKEFGYLGAAITTFISYYISLLMHYHYSRKLNTQILKLKNFYFDSWYLIVAVAGFYLFIDNTLNRLFVSCLIVFTSFFLNKSKIKNFKLDI